VALVRAGDVLLGQELAWCRPFLTSSERLRWLHLALQTLDERAPSSLTFKLQFQLGWQLAAVNDLQGALAALQRAAEVEAFGDQTLHAYAGVQIGYVLNRLARYAEGAVDLERSRALFRKLGDRNGEAAALRHLARSAVDTGSLPQARDMLLSALDMADGDDVALRGLLKIDLSTYEYYLGDPEAALEHSREALAELAAYGSLPMISVFRLNEIVFLVAADRFSEAREVTLKELATALDATDPVPRYVPDYLFALASIAVLRAEPRADSACLERSALVFGWGEGWLRATSSIAGQTERTARDRALAMLRAALGEPRVEALLAEGATLDRDRAIELAVAL